MFTARGGDQIWQCPSRPSAMDARSWKTSNNVEHAPNCPRCASSNTKFCYYNNYSLSQPRYFCKGCRRYWTKGGSLRNVPVGGGCRKNRRSRSAAAAAAAARIPHCERSLNSSNYNSNPNDPFGNSCSLIQENNNGSDIDLAVVFAKFLNQNPEFSGSELSNNEILTPDTSNPSSNVLGDADLLLQEVVGGKEQNGFEGDDMFGMQSLLADQDVLWLDQGADLPSFSWESVEELQEFEDPLKISTNLMMTDNWSSFDLSGFEVFSRPQ